MAIVVAVAAISGGIPGDVHAAHDSSVPMVGQRSGGSGSQNPACAVLTVEEIRNITGFPGYRSPSPGDPPGQGAGGGASCQFEGQGPTVDDKGNAVMLRGPLLSIVLIEGKNYTHTNAVGNGCKKEMAPDVGDEAYFEVCPAAMRARTAPLYVKAGNKDLILQMDVDSPDTEASLKPKLIALAKAAAAKLR
jgi:hypothetical protein